MFNKRHKIVTNPLLLLVAGPSQFIILSAKGKLWTLHTHRIIDLCSMRIERKLNHAIPALKSSCFTLAGPITTCFFPLPLPITAHHPTPTLLRHQPLFTPFQETNHINLMETQNTIPTNHLRASQSTVETLPPETTNSIMPKISTGKQRRSKLVYNNRPPQRA